MRLIKRTTLVAYWQNPRYKSCQGALQSWIFEIINAKWKNHNELKLQFRNASILSEQRVVFNINGNKFRLIVNIDYQFQRVFVIWFGSHAEYDKIDALTVKYD